VVHQGGAWRLDRWCAYPSRSPVVAVQQGRTWALRAAMSHQELPQDRTLAGPLRHRPVRRSPAARRTRRHLPLPESLGSASSVWLPSAIGAASRWLAFCSVRAYWVSKISALVHLGSHGPAGRRGRSPQSAFPSGSMVLTQKSTHNGGDARGFDGRADHAPATMRDHGGLRRRACGRWAGPSGFRARRNPSQAVRQGALFPGPVVAGRW
jgi:hypothetical protein